MSTVLAKAKAILFTATCLVVLLSPLAPGIAWAEDAETVISTGRKGGSYYYIGERLRQAVQLQHRLQIRVETSSGSIQNLARLADPSNDVGLALTQTDALDRFLRDNAAFANEFIVLGDAGKECAILISSKRSDIRSFSDLQKAGSEISVDDPGSGASATFDDLQAMAPGLAQTKAVYVDTMEALLQMKVAGAHTQLKAALLVQRPSTRSAPVRILLENPTDYHLIPILPSDVANRRLPDGSGIYSFEKVNIGSTRGGQTLDVDTVCTRGLLLASKRKLSRELRSKLATSMLESSETVIGQDD
jgi:cytochrome b involved in lipid metabolism